MDVHHLFEEQCALLMQFLVYATIQCIKSMIKFGFVLLLTFGLTFAFFQLCEISLPKGRVSNNTDFMMPAMRSSVLNYATDSQESIRMYPFIIEIPSKLSADVIKNGKKSKERRFGSESYSSVDDDQDDSRLQKRVTYLEKELKHTSFK